MRIQVFYALDGRDSAEPHTTTEAPGRRSSVVGRFEI